jgi:hypothetical protein
MEKTIRRVLLCAVMTTTALGYGQQAEDNGRPDAPEGKTQITKPAGQTEAPQQERSFQLTFTSRELDANGKVVNSRRFETMTTIGSLKAGGVTLIRAGAKIPVAAGGTSFTYVDIGANFDVGQPRIVKGNQLAMRVSAEISSIDNPTGSETQPRAIHQNRWQGDVEVPIGGRKVIFSSDDLSSKKAMEIELAVTPVDK